MSASFFNIERPAGSESNGSLRCFLKNSDCKMSSKRKRRAALGESEASVKIFSSSSRGCRASGDNPLETLIFGADKGEFMIFLVSLLEFRIICGAVESLAPGSVPTFRVST